MLTHVVLIKFKPGTPHAEIERLLDGLRTLPGEIPEIRGYELGEDVVHAGRSFDAGLIARFDDLEGLKRYQAHPKHVPLGGGLQAIAEQMIAVDWVD
ncbi:MAG: Dabb family protein [Rudaea sp.]